MLISINYLSWVWSDVYQTSFKSCRDFHIIFIFTNRITLKFWVLCYFCIPEFDTLLCINPFVPNAPFLYLLEISENRKDFWCFQGVEKGCIWIDWVKKVCDVGSFCDVFREKRESALGTNGLMCIYYSKMTDKAGPRIHFYINLPLNSEHIFEKKQSNNILLLTVRTRKAVALPTKRVRTSSSISWLSFE